MHLMLLQLPLLCWMSGIFPGTKNSKWFFTSHCTIQHALTPLTHTHESTVNSDVSHGFTCSSSVHTFSLNATCNEGIIWIWWKFDARATWSPAWVSFNACAHWTQQTDQRTNSWAGKRKTDGVHLLLLLLLLPWGYPSSVGTRVSRGAAAPWRTLSITEPKQRYFSLAVWDTARARHKVGMHFFFRAIWGWNWKFLFLFYFFDVSFI